MVPRALRVVAYSLLAFAVPMGANVGMAAINTASHRWNPDLARQWS
jgi:hypothetical protein